MAGQAQKRGLPPQLPLMASLVESGMKNLNFGDADSVGFFQMRVGIWNQGAYAGYPDKPELQVKWFLDQAEAVKKQRLVAGKPIDDPNSFGEWIADVERPAEQYRGRYQTKLAEANRLLASSPQQPAAAPVAAAPVDPAAAAASAAAVGNAKLPPEILGPVQDAIAAGNVPGPKALAAIEEASKHLGTDYVWGGSTPQTGFDCSGLMQWSYAQSGVQIPRVTYTQIEAPNGTEVADRVEPQARRPGVLLQRRRRPPRRHVPRRPEVPARAQHGRRREGLEPRRAVLRGPVRRRAPLRRGRAVAAAPARGRRPGGAGRRPDRGRPGAGRGRARRRRGPAPGLRAVPRRQGRGGDQGDARSTGRRCS